MLIPRNRLVVLTMTLFGLFLPVMFLPLAPWLVILLQKVADLYFWGPVALAGICVAASVLPIPALIPVMASGFLFGLFVGSLVSVIGTTVGACAAFLIAQVAARNWIAGRRPLHGRLAALDRAASEQGFKIVLLSRLSPFAPFLSLNYAFGLTRVSFRQYAWGTLLGGGPGTILFVFCGAGLHSLQETITCASGEGEPTTAQHIFFWASLALTIVVTVWLTRIARRALRQVLPNHDSLEN